MLGLYGGEDLDVIFNIITPYIYIYIRILDFDWLIAGGFFVYFHI